MTLPNVFATESGNQPAAQLDDNFIAVANMGLYRAIAAGTNIITLSLRADQPDIVAYKEGMGFYFVAQSTSSGPVTAGLGSIPDINVYRQDGNQADAGDIVANSAYIMFYDSAFNSGAGGFQLTTVNPFTTLPAGTTTKAPLTFTAGALLTTALAGSMEVGPTGVLYYTPKGAQRGIIEAAQEYLLQNIVAGSNVNTALPALGVGVTLSSSTIYEFEAAYYLSKSAGATSHTIGLSFGGTATLFGIGYDMLHNISTSFTTSSAVNPDIMYIQLAANTVISSASVSASQAHIIKLSGFVVINVGGTLIPQYQTSAAPGASYTTAIGSYFKIWPVGASGASINVGTWA